MIFSRSGVSTRFARRTVSRWKAREVATACSIFSDKLGIVMHFPKLQFLTDYVLNPRWLTYGVYTIMYSDEARTAQGRLSEADLVRILKKAISISDRRVLRYPRDRCGIIANAMIAFRVAYVLATMKLLFRRFSRPSSRCMISNQTAHSPSASISAVSCRAMSCPRLSLSNFKTSRR